MIVFAIPVLGSTLATTPAVESPTHSCPSPAAIVLGVETASTLGPSLRPSAGSRRVRRPKDGATHSDRAPMVALAPVSRGRVSILTAGRAASKRESILRATT